MIRKIAAVVLALMLFASPAAASDKDKVFVAAVHNNVPSLVQKDPALLTDLAKVVCIERRIGFWQFEVALGMYKFLGVPYYTDARMFTNLAVQFYCPRFEYAFPA